MSRGQQRRPRLRKALGQHHLHQPEVLAPLLEYLDCGGRWVVEVGPGGGVLTGPLRRLAARVTALELDPAWAAELSLVGTAARDDATLDLVVMDALRFDWSRLGVQHRVAGNLPYAIATALVEGLLDGGAAGLRAAFLVQLEVAERLTATRGEPGYGSLSVLVAARASSRILGRVKPGSFRPPPKVDSAFVGLELEAPPRDWPTFKRIVRLAFRHRRKTLVNSLAGELGRETARALCRRAGLPAGARAEELDLEHHRRLVEAFDGVSSP